MVGGGRYDVIDADPPRRRGPGWLGAVVVVGLIAVPVAVVMLGRGDGAGPPAATTATPRPALSVIETRPNALVPEPRRAGRDAEAVDVTFPDGSRARVSYPARLGLAALGVRPAIGVRHAAWDGFRILYAPLEGEAEIAAGGQRLRRLTDDVSLWPQRAGRDGGYVTVFRFGRWILAMDEPRGDGVAFDERMDLARHVRGTVPRRGFLVLRAGGPVTLGRPGETYGDAPVGPQLWFGGVGGRVVVLAPTPGCDARSPMPAIVTGQGYTAKTCKGDMLVAVGAERWFAQRVLKGIEVRAMGGG
ncbi:hypothetical protein HNP84_002414 [Thermocatellispora tengchongensis]|uniref:Uncharacterized protein n=1 Tax=Thermocatellispora tengchongensis TaxID=1073253 RepID=A0A840NYX8_9ACTN|nr:hypothetical protein [Thermocatellispora tengchongensis]MBB5132698.1 hypothetical protein [Thermocatellispora tengchongensis]